MQKIEGRNTLETDMALSLPGADSLIASSTSWALTSLLQVSRKDEQFWGWHHEWNHEQSHIYNVIHTNCEIDRIVWFLKNSLDQIITAKKFKNSITFPEFQNGLNKDPHAMCMTLQL